MDAVIEAARQLPQTHVYITGNASRQPKSFWENLPCNVTCTGFLPDARYIGLLNAVDVIMVLTTRNHTLQLGGCEAVSAGQPLITSDWPYLQSFFPDGTIHVANTPEGIRTGVLMAQKEHGRLKEEMVRFREVGRQQWNIQVARLVERVAQVTHS